MKKWLVSIPITADAMYEVEAETEKDAIQKAYEIGLPSLCNQCANEVEINDFGYDGDALADEINDK